MTRSTSFSDPSLPFRKAARLVMAGALASFSIAMPAAADPAATYSEHCADCHGADRLGGTGPALSPETLRKIRGPNLADVILNGRVATQMPGFSDYMDQADADAMVELLRTPLEELPPWGEEQINASRDMNPDYTPVDKPVWDADPMNITVVVETGDHHVSVLDGDTFEVLDRFPTPFAVHGGPKYDPTGRYLFIMSRDGWVQKYDIYALQTVGQVRAGLNSRNIAMSSDGKWLAVASYLPNLLTILNTEDLTVAKVQPVVGKNGTPSRVSAVYQVPPRESFVLALKDVPEIWEIFYGPNPPQFGFAHDWRTEGLAHKDIPFPVRKITLPDYLDDFFFDQTYEYIMGASRDGAEGTGGQVVDLVIGHKIADLDLPGMPHLSSGTTWERNGTTVMATPHMRGGVVSVIDMSTWETIKKIEAMGPGFFVRSHENSPYIWADVFFGPNRDIMHVIDKQSLEIVKSLQPAPGKTVAHVEFTKDGRYALVSVWEDDGEVLVYDARSLEIVKRLPMRKPSGKYNVWNKITFSEGTSH